MAIALSKITSSDPLSKGYDWVDGAFKKTEKGGEMYRGVAERLHIADLRELSQIIGGLTTNQALTFGTVKEAGQRHTVTTLEHHIPGLNIARARDFFEFPAHASGILLLDYDPPKAQGVQPLDAEALLATLHRVVPALADCETLVSASATSYLYRKDNGACVKGAGGLHLFVTVSNAADIPAIGQAVFDRCWLAGLGRVDISQDWSLLLRSLVDDKVWQPERFSYDAGAMCGPGLEQRRPDRLYHAGRALCLADIAITDTEKATIAELKEQAKARVSLLLGQRLWDTGWTCTHAADMPADWDRGLSAGEKETVRLKIERERQAVITYLTARLGPEHLEHWLRQVRIARDHKGNIMMLTPMVAMTEESDLIGVQRTYLTESGTKTKRKMLGKQGVFPLVPPMGVAPASLVIHAKKVKLFGEGFETVAAVVQSAGVPGLVCYSTHGMDRWTKVLTDGVQSDTPEQVANYATVLVLADRDASQTGQRAAARAVRHLREAGIQAVFAAPRTAEDGGPKGGTKGSDWGDYPQEGLAHALVPHLQRAIALGDEEMPTAQQATPKLSGKRADNKTQRDLKLAAQHPKMRKAVDALASIPADCDYMTWIAVGMALKSGFGDRGFPLWDTWSSQATNYPGTSALLYKYQSFGNGYAGREITLGSLFHYAHQYGWEPDNTRALWPVRTAKKPLPVAAGMDLVSARSKAQKIVDKVVAVAKKRAEAFSRYREELNAYNAEREKSQKENKKCKAKKPKRPHFPPLNVGAQLFTGVGKTHLFEQLIQRLKALDIPTVIVALNKNAAEQYAAAGAFWRQGREDQTGKGGFNTPNHCPKMGFVTTLGEQEHTIAAEMCNAYHCEHGVARAAKKPLGGLEPQVIQFYKEHPEARKAEPCVFLDHLDDASKETVIVLTSQALSPGELTTKDGRPRMVIVDEDFSVAHITSATATDLTGYLAAIQGVSVHIRADLDRLSTFTGKNVEDRQAVLRRELEKLQLMTNVFNDLGQCIGGLLHTDGNPVIPQNLNQLAAKMQGAGPMGKAQPWEKPIWERWTDLDTTPLRTAGELMDSIQKGTLRVVDGTLKIPYFHPLVDAARQGDMPILFADATLSPDVRGLILSTEGEIYKVVGQYQQPVIIDPRWYHAQLSQNDPDYQRKLKQEAQRILDTLDQRDAQTSIRHFIIANRPKAIAALAIRLNTDAKELEALPKSELWDLTIREGIGWWGWHDTAHDSWNGWSCIQWDQPALPEHAKRDRVLAYNGLMGVLGGDFLPEYTDDYASDLWVTTGAEQQQSRARLHKNPQLRDFFQNLIDARRIQALGRSRLALHPECQAYILGGTPPSTFAEHGYSIEYQRVIQAYTGDEQGAVAHQKRIRQLDEAAVALINAGKTITNQGLQAQCRKMHGTAPRNATVTEWMATRGPILAEFCSKYGRNAKKTKAVVASIAERMGPHATMTLDLLLEMLEAGLHIAAEQQMPPTQLDAALQEALRQACAADHPDDHMRYAMRRAAVEIFRRHVLADEAAPPLARTG